jgi:hypothetical protein
MVIEIEYYKGDILLYGQKISFKELKKQIENIESFYDRNEDNFIALLCRVYNWTIIKDKVQAVYIYDRDIQKAYIIKHGFSG